MKAKEEFLIRQQMAEMHDEFISRMSQAYDDKHYVETVWYCYAIFEQRINRLISKYIEKCTLFPTRTDEKSVNISTRITCLKKLINAQYGSFYLLDVNLFVRISKWCEDRNDLVHGLISFKHYKKYDDEFKTLAETGVPLVFELYDVCTDFRNNWYKSKEPTEPFPIIKCKCKNKKCINEKIV